MARTPVNQLVSRQGSTQVTYTVPEGKILIFRPFSPPGGVGIGAALAINGQYMCQMTNAQWGPGGITAKAGDVVGLGFQNGTDYFSLVINGMLFDAPA